jgi:alcohol dehydrogenase
VLLASGRRNVSELEPLDFTRLFDEQRAVDRRFPVVVVSTTLSFAEMLPFWGARHVALQRKLAYPDLGCVERTVFLDGEVAVHTPSDVWLETGVKALDDAVAAWCRGTAAEPFLDPLLAEAIRLLVERLPASGGGGATAARQDVLVACWMTKLPLPRLGPVAVAAWLSTTARHALGAVRAVGHGAGSCVALEHALRFHAPGTRSRQAALASQLGWRRDDDAPLAAGVADLLDTLRVPRRLRDVGVGADALPGVVAAMRAESPGLGSPAELLELCERML